MCAVSSESFKTTQPPIKGQGSCGFHISTHSNHSEDPADHTPVYSLCGEMAALTRNAYKRQRVNKETTAICICTFINAMHE